MKLSALLFICAVIVSSCCSTKKTQTEVSETPFYETLVIEDKATVNEGLITSTAIPIKGITEKPETPATPEVPATPETTEVPTEPVVETPVVTAPAPIADIEEMTSHPPPLTHEAWNTLLTQFVTKNGRVDYNAFKNNRSKLTKYISHLAENLPTEENSKNEKLAYWMNAYNAMTVDLIIRNLPTESIKNIKDPWEQRLWKLGAKWYNLDEIEHQILRKMGDARIHFGINCASFSCPPLLNEAFVASKVDAQLDEVAKKFINDSSRNMISENSLEISNIFKWFSKDFKQNGSVIDYLNKYATVNISEDAKVRYMDYDWSLNN